MSEMKAAGPGQAFDYVIVGGGAAGCILANRLSEHAHTTVCLIEAGPRDKNLFINIPAGFVKVLGNARYTWNFMTEPTARTAGRAIPLIQGRTLGGGTSVNGMAYNRGQRRDFDHWAEIGNPGWSYEELLPIFKELEDRQSGDPRYRGRGGALAVTDVTWADPLCHAFVDAAVEAGIPLNADTNGATQEGVSFSQVNIKNGRRISSSSAFLRPALARRNLHVITEAMATKVLFRNRKAVGVRFRRAGIESEVTANREVILSCGAINTPRLLQVSGVGNAEQLTSIGVPVVHDLPGVGANFHDHYMVQMVARGKRFTSINQMARPPRLWWEVLRWIAGKPSVLGLPVALVHYFMRSGLSDGDADIQGIFTPASHMTGDKGGLDRYSGMTCAVWQHRPTSRGYVRATSAEVLDAPVVQPNYLHTEEDRRVLIAACRKTREVLAAGALKPFFDTELMPGHGVQSDDEWLDFAGRTGSTVYHPVGTAKMGPASDPFAVVNDKLQVHGVEGLRVVDASVMPSVTSGNTAAATMVIGEKGARMILSSQAQRNG